MWINKNKYLYEKKLKDDEISQNESTIRFLKRKIKSMETPVQERKDTQALRVGDRGALAELQRRQQNAAQQVQYQDSFFGPLRSALFGSQLGG